MFEIRLTAAIQLDSFFFFFFQPRQTININIGISGSMCNVNKFNIDSLLRSLFEYLQTFSST